MGRKKNSIGHHLKYYCYMLNIVQEANIELSGYHLQSALNLLPKQLKEKPKYRNNKWDRYFIYGGKSPSPDTLEDIKKMFPKSDYILELPLWDIFDNHKQPEHFYYEFLLKSPASIKRHIFKKSSPYQLKKSLSSRVITAIVRIGNSHALACLLALAILSHYKSIQVPSRIALPITIEDLLKGCCIQSPLDKIKAELHDAVTGLLHGYDLMPTDFDIFETKKVFLSQTQNLMSVFTILLTWHITEGKNSEKELVFWLLKSDDKKVLNDMQRVQSKLPIFMKQLGLLWLFEQMMYQSNGLMKARLAFLCDEFKEPKALSR